MTVKKEERPILKIGMTLADKFMEIVVLLVLIAFWIVTFLKFQELPVTPGANRPLETDAGNIDAKGWMFFLPVICSVFYLGMTILNKYPHMFNYPTKITNQNAEEKYAVATRLIRYLKFILVPAFFLVAWLSSPKANQSLSGLVPWFLLLFAGLIYVPMVYAIFKLLKSR
jgi:hypothetical protein